ncbi:hypothetical protein [Lachnoclostridium sp. Marseille-P6806]|uniref:hypothetical protein n=1 Tax=Lachnoclostridium sp. Marseille-P6806 TaxID=2364793 RepID=UPI001F5FF27F|nr:hypothetical protein [Lachnoclostridium sp. Marseille-P6806]
MRPATRNALRRKHFRRRTKALIAAALIVAVLTAGFYRPGFFVRGRRTGGSGDFFSPASMVNSAGIEITPLSSPGNPALIGVRYSAKELREAPVLSAELTQEKNTAQLSEEVSAELPPWDLEEPDTIELRTLPVKTDSDMGMRLIAYDFSLKSGKHEFATEAKLTIPRSCGDGFGEVVYYNEESGKWETVYHETSADGRSYEVYMDHFSLVAEIVSERMEHYGSLEKAGFSSLLIEYPFGKGKYDYFSSAIGNVGERGMFSDFRPAMNSVGPVPFEEMVKILDSEIYTGMMEACADYMGKAIDLYGTGELAVDGGKYLMQMARSGLRGTQGGAGLQPVAAEAASSPTASTSIYAKYLGPAMATAGLLIYAYQLSVYFENGGTWAGYVSSYDNVTTMLGVTAGTMGAFMTLAKAGLIFSMGTVLSVASALIGGYYLYVAAEDALWPRAFKEKELISLEEYAYRQYLQEKNSRVIPGYELDVLGNGFAELFDDRFGEAMKKRSVDVAGNVEKDIDAFLGYYWDELSEQERKDYTSSVKPSFWYYNRQLGEAGKIVPADGYRQPTEKMIGMYKAAARRELYGNTEKIFRAFNSKFRHLSAVELYRFMRDELCPLLNVPIVVRAYMGQDKNGDITKTAYYGYDAASGRYSDFMADMRFASYEEPTFFPRNVFRPNSKVLAFAPTRSNNIIYMTTMYHYLQYHSPTEVIMDGRRASLPLLRGKLVFDQKKGQRFGRIDGRVDFVREDIFGVWDVELSTLYYGGNQIFDGLIEAMPDEGGMKESLQQGLDAAKRQAEQTVLRGTMTISQFGNDSHERMFVTMDIEGMEPFTEQNGTSFPREMYGSYDEKQRVLKLKPPELLKKWNINDGKEIELQVTLGYGGKSVCEGEFHYEFSLSGLGTAEATYRLKGTHR